MQTLNDNDNGDTLEEKNQETPDNYFDMGQGKIEAMQDHINREDMMSL